MNTSPCLTHNADHKINMKFSLLSVLVHQLPLFKKELEFTCFDFFGLSCLVTSSLRPPNEDVIQEFGFYRHYTKS